MHVVTRSLLETLKLAWFLYAVHIVIYAHNINHTDERIYQWPSSDVCQTVTYGKTMSQTVKLVG